jgi:hypothetical protein
MDGMMNSSKKGDSQAVALRGKAIEVVIEKRLMLLGTTNFGV